MTGDMIGVGGGYEPEFLDFRGSPWRFGSRTLFKRCAPIGVKFWQSFDPNGWILTHFMTIFRHKLSLGFLHDILYLPTLSLPTFSEGVVRWNRMVIAQ